MLLLNVLLQVTQFTVIASGENVTVFTTSVVPGRCGCYTLHAGRDTSIESRSYLKNWTFFELEMFHFKGFTFQR